jgi:hypothetical protein
LCVINLAIDVKIPAAEASEEAKEQYIVKTHLACLSFVKPVLEKLLQRVSKIASHGTAAYALSF